jgi:hypothetical protein
MHFSLSRHPATGRQYFNHSYHTFLLAARCVLFWGGVTLLTTEAFAQPWQPEIIWDRSGLQDSSAYGYKILPLGDQNDDSYADWAVYAMGNFSRAGTYHGNQHAYIEFFHGGDPPETVPYLTVTEELQILWPPGVLEDVDGDGVIDYYLDWASSLGLAYDSVLFYRGGNEHDTVSYFSLVYTDVLRPVGDFNGDQYADFCVFSSEVNRANYYYGALVPDTVVDLVIEDSSSLHVNLDPQFFGDFNGDHFADVVCQSFGLNAMQWIFLGAAQPRSLPGYTWQQSGAPSGYVIGALRDVNGDGFDEICFSREGGAAINWGRPQLSQTPDISVIFAGTECWPEDAIGVGDINNDGYHDFALYTSYCSSMWFGVLTVYLGGTWVNPEPALTISGSGAPYDFVGIWTAEGLGDVNGDGINDWAVGSFDDFAGEGWRGRCVIFAGDSTIHAAALERKVPVAEEIGVSVYPNPFNAETTIDLRVNPQQGTVNLQVFDLLGQSVYEQHVHPQSVRTSFHFAGRDCNGVALATGLYIVRAQQAEQFAATKMVVIR